MTIVREEIFGPVMSILTYDTDEEAIRRAVQLGYEGEGPAILCLLAKGDETRQHEGNEFVPCRTDGDIYEEAVRNWHAAHPEA